MFEDFWFKLFQIFFLYCISYYKLNLVCALRPDEIQLINPVHRNRNKQSNFIHSDKMSSTSWNLGSQTCICSDFLTINDCWLQPFFRGKCIDFVSAVLMSSKESHQLIVYCLLVCWSLDYKYLTQLHETKKHQWLTVCSRFPKLELLILYKLD